MADIPWNSEAHLLKSTGAGEEVEASGVLYQLVGAFIEMEPDQQDSLMIRAVAGGDLFEFDADAIRELAADPAFTGVSGPSDDEPEATELDEDEEGPAAPDIDGEVPPTGRE